MPVIESQRTDDVNFSLLQRCLSNDPEACNELFSLYNRKVFNTAYRILGEEASAEDALQETFLNVYRGIGRFRGDSKISTWISRITINVCLGMLRKGKTRQFVELEDEMARELPAESTPFSDPLAHTSLEELRSVVNETFERISQKQGIVVRLHDMEGYTIQEIAEAIGCPVGTVKSRLFYGRQEFRAVFNSLLNNGFKTSAPSLN
ncbi:MAG: sigma-70 family RNA polymerase sigma factor [Acidobacteria bacterium]|nr:sigma-70 family RNA polymerase sigma factor [Acidobacteriota bacterium]